MKAIAFIRLCLIPIFFSCFQVSAQSISGVINSYYKVTAVNSLTNILTVTSSAGLAVGTKIMLIQMKGASMDNSNTASFGNVTAINDAGNYEFNYICGITGNNLLLQRQLLRTYDTSGLVQLITVPVFRTVTVTDTVKADVWNAPTGVGGIVVFEATDTVLLNSVIDASGKGFSGGALMNYPTPTYNCVWNVNVSNYYLSVPPSPNLYYTGGKKGEGVADYVTNAEYGRGRQVNGGGGGNNHNTGGGGGGNYGNGGNGGNRSNESAFNCHGTNPGIGGGALTSFGYNTSNNRIFLGGGGGSGHQNNAQSTPGGEGGGIAIILTNVIISSGGKILSNGVTPTNLANPDPTLAGGDGGGGGGAGGCIVVKANTITGTITTEARGGKGSDASYNVTDCLGPGGGGGGGAIWISGVSFPGSITTNVVGGINGIISNTCFTSACRGAANGAAAGSTGAALTGYVEPLSTNVICAPLPVTALLFFNGKSIADKILLQWKMQQEQDITWYEVERSIDQVHYKTIASIKNTNEKNYHVYDAEAGAGNFYYRLQLKNKNGTISYSQILRIVKTGAYNYAVQLMPNPARNKITVQLFAEKEMVVAISIYNSNGQIMSKSNHQIKIGLNKISLDVQHVPEGIQLIKIESGEMRITKRWVKVS